jgi:outer membrane protein W
VQNRENAVILTGTRQKERTKESSMRTRIAILTVLAATLTLSIATTAHARPVEFYLGGGGGYEWFDLKALDYSNLLSVEAIDTSGDTVAYNPPLDRYKGSSFIYDAYLGIKLLSFVIAVDYRGSQTMDSISFSQLMGEFTFFIPTNKVKPFFRLGVGYVWMSAKIEDNDPNYDPIVDNLRAKGLGARLGGGVDFRLVKFFSFGFAVDVGFLYFSNDNGKSFGMNTDVLARLTLHV